MEELLPNPNKRNPQFDQVKDAFFLTSWIQLHSFINIFRSFSRRLRKSDLFNLKKRFWPEYNIDQFNQIQHHWPDAGLLTQIFRYFIFWEYICAGILVLLASALQLVGPLAIKQIITFLTEDQFNQETKTKAEIYAFVLICAYFVKIFIQEYSQRMFYMSSLRVGQVLHHLLLMKISRMSFQKKVKTQKIYMANNMIIETNEIMQSIASSGILFSLPITAILVQIFLFFEFQYYAFSFMGSFILGIVIQLFIDKKMGFYSTKLVVIQHQKYGINTQFVRSFKQIAVLGWQNLIIQKNQKFRQIENQTNSKIYKLKGLFNLTSNLIPVLAVMITIVLYFTIHDSKSIDPVVVFTIITYCGLVSNLNDIYDPLSGLRTIKKIQKKLEAEQLKISSTYDQNLQKGKLILTKLVAKWKVQGTSLERLQDILLLDKKQIDFQSQSQSEQQELKGFEQEIQKEISYIPITQQSLSQSLLSKPPKQQNTGNKKQIRNQKITKIKHQLIDKFEKLEVVQDFQFQKNRLIILGDVQSGKSSFLHMIMGNLSIEQGIAKYGGKIGYMPQNIWFQRSSVRQNIIFGCPLNLKWLRTVYQWLDMRQQMRLLDSGDRTQINQNIFMTEKQKKKIALARALYCRPDILVMDEPFLFLDSEKTKILYNKICKQFQDKIIIIATKSQQFMNPDDHVLVLKNGKVVQSNKYSQMKSNLQSELHKIQIPKLSKINIVAVNNVKQLTIIQKKRHYARIRFLKEKLRRFVKELVQMTKGKSRQQIDAILLQKCGPVGDRSKAKQQDKQPTERIKSTFFLNIKRLFKISPVFFVLLVLMSILAQTVFVYSMYWIGSQQLPWQITYQIQLIIYFVLVFIFSFFWCLSGILIPKLSQKVVNNVVSDVTKSIAYMQHNKAVKEAFLIPTLTLNKQTDQYYNLNTSIQRIIGGYITLLISVILVAISSPIFYGVGFAVSIIYFLAKYFLLRASREIYVFNYLQYPITALYEQTITGVETFRAFNKIQSHIDKCRNILYNFTVFRANHRFLFHGISIVCKLLGLGLLAAAVFFAISAKGRLPDYSVGLLGASISFILDLSSMLNEVILQSVDLSNIIYDTIQDDFNTIDQPLDSTFFRPKKPKGWPTDGTIEFKNADLVNPMFDQPVMKNLSMKIESGEQLALFGSDDIAKMAVIYSLLRYYHNSNDKGFVKISDFEVQKIGRKYLLQQVRILSTDPFSFKGSVRQNMDPFFQHTDQQLIQALKKTKAWNRLRPKDSVPDTPQNRLNQLFIDRTKYDLLQRINISRALLKDLKVIISVSITDSLNRKSAEFLQNLLMSDFKKSTRIFISQNRDTVIKADKLAYIEKSKMKDFGSPIQILNKAYKVTVKPSEQKQIQKQMIVQEIKKQVEAKQESIKEENSKLESKTSNRSDFQPSINYEKNQ